MRQSFSELLLVLIHRGSLDRETLRSICVDRDTAQPISPSHLSRCLSGERPFTAEQYEAVAAYLSDRGCDDVQRRTLSPARVIASREAAAADGKIEDEVRDGVSAFGAAITAHAARDRDALLRAIEEQKAVTARLEAEADRL